MPYRIYQFGSVALPDVLPEDDLGTGAVGSSLLLAAGGAFDWATGRRRLPLRRSIPFRGRYMASESSLIVDHLGNQIVDHLGNRIIAGTAATMLRAQVDVLRAMLGSEASLYRRREDDSAVQWVTARLLQLQQVRTVDDAGVVAEVAATFETLMPAWRSSTQTATSGTAAAAGTVALVIDNGGDVTVEDAVLTVTATAAISSVRVVSAQAGVDWTWTGSLGAGSSLVVDAGAKTVRAAGVDAYSGFVLGSGHSAESWLALVKGRTPLAVTVDAAGAVSVGHWNQFV